MLSKPWEEALTFEKHTWQLYADRVTDRAGIPPASTGNATYTAS
jgi:hypothetical protein